MQEMDPKPKSLRDVRDFLNTCTEDQLDYPAILMGTEDAPGGPVFVEALGEDYALTEEGVCPISQLTKEEKEENTSGIYLSADRVFFGFQEGPFISPLLPDPNLIQVIGCIKFPVRYDSGWNCILDADDNNICEIRGWGLLQQINKIGDEHQTSMGKSIAELINSNWKLS